MGRYKVKWNLDKMLDACAYLTHYFERYGVGECIMQSDNAIIEAPDLLSKIADKVLIEGEGITYTDEEE